MALSFIGKPISLISHSDVRYRGILAGIDPVASTIQLSNVYSMGTESRRPPAQYIAPVPDPYAYIIFRASEVKDLAVDEAPPQTQASVHDDPAVLNASAPIAQAPYPPAQQTQQPQQYQQPQQPAPPAQSQQQQPPPPQPDQQQPQQQQQQQQQQQSRPQSNTSRRNPVQTAAASLQSVQRALGDLRVSAGDAAPNGSGTQGRGGASGRRGGGRGGSRAADGGEATKVPLTDFDFQSSNARFDKASLATPAKAKSSTANDEGSDEEEEEDESAEKKEAVAYNPQKSFFDSLSSSNAADAHRGGGNPGRGRRGGPNAGRMRREEEREKNVATFGEPGGVGLLGPGGYVGGWGGYRRGGRPRRGGPRGGAAGGSGPGQNQPVQART